MCKYIYIHIHTLLKQNMNCRISYMLMCSIIFSQTIIVFAILFSKVTCQPESKNVSKWRKFLCEIKREHEGKKDRKRACCLSECVQGRNMCPQFYCTAQNCV